MKNIILTTENCCAYQKYIIPLLDGTMLGVVSCNPCQPHHIWKRKIYLRHLLIIEGLFSIQLQFWNLHTKKGYDTLGQIMGYAATTILYTHILHSQQRMLAYHAEQTYFQWPSELQKTVLGHHGILLPYISLSHLLDIDHNYYTSSTLSCQGPCLKYTRVHRLWRA